MNTGRQLCVLAAALVVGGALAGCSSGDHWQLPDAQDPAVQDRQAQLAQTIEADATRSWGSGHGRWACTVRYLGTAVDSATALAWATCRSNGKTEGAFTAPVTVTGATVEVAEDGDGNESWVRARFPEPLADLVIAQDSTVMPNSAGGDQSDATGTQSPPAGYVVVPVDLRAGRVPYECGGVDVPPTILGRVNSAMRAEQVETVTICRNPGKAKFPTYLTPQAPNWATIDGNAATTEQVQALLDALGTPDEPTPMPNSCTAVGVIPADAMYLTLTDGTNLQPVIPVDHCDRQIDAARGTIEAFP